MLPSWATTVVCAVAAHLAGLAAAQPPPQPGSWRSLANDKVYIVLKEGSNGEGSPSDLRTRGGLSHFDLPAGPSQQGRRHELPIVYGYVNPSLRIPELEGMLVGGLTTEREARFQGLEAISHEMFNQQQRFWIYELSTAPQVLTFEPGAVDPAVQHYHFAIGGLPWSQVRQFSLLSRHNPTMREIGERLAAAEDQFNDEASEAAKREADSLVLEWMANRDFNPEWTSFGATEVPLTVFQHQTPADMLGTLVSRERIPDEQQRRTLRKLLKWDPEAKPPPSLPLLQHGEPLALDVSILHRLDWGRIPVPLSLQMAMASGLANAQQCLDVMQLIRLAFLDAAKSGAPSSSSSSKRSRRGEDQSCQQLVDLIKANDQIPKECRTIRSIELEVALSDDWGAGTYDKVGITVEGPAGRTAFTFGEHPDSGTRRVFSIDAQQYFGASEIDMTGIDKITFSAEGRLFSLVQNDKFIVQDVVLRANCSDAAFRAQNTKYVGVHKTYQHPGQESFLELFGKYKQKKVGELQVRLGQWSFTPPCAYIKDLRYEFHTGPSNGDGTFDTVFFKLGRGKRVVVGKNIDAGAALPGVVDLERTYGNATVHVGDLTKLTIWDELASENWIEKGDEWRFQGITFTATCAAVARKVSMTKFAKVGKTVQHAGNDKPVWTGEVLPRDWQEVA